eukprot:GHVS01100657.1.p1 GENE.GHVS01100657.1~~GHVS01100657.1.p1  ORF type:complete len:177 (+),score=21.11 GHVS01100657.1:45-575(+)
MKTLTMRRVVGGATLVVVAVCLALTVEVFGQPSVKREGGNMQSQLGLEAFVKKVYLGLSSGRLLDNIEDFFTRDSSFQTLVPNSENGFFAQKLRNEHSTKVNEQKWDEAVYVGFRKFERITREFLSMLPLKRSWMHSIVMMREVSEGAHLLTVDGSIKAEGDKEWRCVEVGEMEYV